jgi:hypothetical protein
MILENKCKLFLNLLETTIKALLLLIFKNQRIIKIILFAI